MKTIYLIVCLFFTVNIHAQIDDCSNCSDRLLTKKDIEGKSLEELSRLRNEIFARNGYTFSTPLYDWYFSTKGWYSPAESNSSVQLSAIATQNVEFLKEQEAIIQKRRDNAIRDLKILRKSLNENDKETVLRFMKVLKQGDEEHYDHFIEQLKYALNKIDFEDINWNKGRGLYGITIDNGYCISEYKLYFENDTVTVHSSEIMDHSEIFGDFGDGYSDYMSESTSSYLFVFYMKDNGLKFQTIFVAG